MPRVGQVRHRSPATLLSRSCGHRSTHHSERKTWPGLSDIRSAVVPTFAGAEEYRSDRTGDNYLGVRSKLRSDYSAYCSLTIRRLRAALDPATREVELRKSLGQPLRQAAIECLEDPILRHQFCGHAQLLIREAKSVVRLRHFGFQGDGLLEC